MGSNPIPSVLVYDQSGRILDLLNETGKVSNGRWTFRDTL